MTEAQRLELEKGFRAGKSHTYRMPCRAILLKSQDLKSEDVGSQTEMTLVSVNAWVKRFESEGIAGLETRPERGRKPIMDCLDKEAVRKAIEQSVKKAKESWQQVSGKEASESMFRAFLSALARDIDV
ncbi:helix-turn-helix domain-containing protein [Bacteroides finegoldii]|uniref:helix-turn-helix domain-containing protein n=1 Tax=Bacteroides finegoldii TaxID=338188 RepID=UPI0003702172|nr:helix-turn-helix domain-containing protein [Bacteroides finegoldii]